MAQLDEATTVARARRTPASWSAHIAGRRARHNGPVIAVVLLITLLSTSVLVALGQLVVVTQNHSVALALTTVDDSALDVTVAVVPDWESPTLVLAHTARAIEDALDGAPGTSQTWVQSPKYALPRSGDGSQLEAVTYLATYAGHEDHVELASGRWAEAVSEMRTLPASTRGLAGLPDYLPQTLEYRVSEVTVPEVGLEALQAEVGDVVVLNGGLRGDAIAVEIVGTWRTTGAIDAEFWSTDLTHGAGLMGGYPLPRMPDLTTDLVGPAFTSMETFDSLTSLAENVTTVFRPDVSVMSAQRAAELIGPSRDLTSTIRSSSYGAVSSIDVTSHLGRTLSDVVGAASITQASMTVVGLVLLVLVVSALLQATRLLVEARASEVTLLRARGASSRQVLRLAAVEAFWLAAITVGAGPYLGTAVYSFLASTGPMQGAGLTVVPQVGIVAWSIAGVCALLLVVILLAPLVRGEGSFVEAEAARARPPRSTFVQRTGLDLVLVGLAGVAVWQLNRYDSPVTDAGAASGGGATTNEIDPLLAAGPALVLLAGALLAARLVPLLARGAELVAARGRGATTSLAAWEIGRRPTRTVAAVVLLALALAVGTFCLTFLRTWNVSQAEQAQFRVGTDVRVQAQLTPPLTQSPKLLTQDVTSVKPALVERGKVGFPDGLTEIRNSVPAQILGLDHSSLDTLTTGPLAQTPAALAASALLDSRTQVEGIPLPQGTNALRADVKYTSSTSSGNGLVASLIAVVRDANGVVQSVEVGGTKVGTDRWQLVGAITPPVMGEALAEPLELIALHTRWMDGGHLTVPRNDKRIEESPDPGDKGSSLHARLFSFEAATIIDPSGSAALPEMRTELNKMPPCAPGASEAEAEALGCLLTTPLELTKTFAERQHLFGARATLTTPLRSDSQSQLYYGISSDGWTVLYSIARSAHVSWETVGRIPVVITETLADSLAVTIDSELSILVRDVPVPVTVTGIVPSLPGAATRSSGLLVNLEHLTLASAERGGDTDLATEWWVDLVGDDEPSPATDARFTSDIDDAGWVTVESLSAQIDALRDSPVRVGTPVVLWLVTLTAALLAGLGFAVRTTVTLRARSVEFSQLRAIGLHRRSLVGVVAIETLLLSVLGTALGIGLGAGLGRLLTPLVSLTADGSPAEPAVTVLVPWTEVLLLAGGVCIALALVMAVLTRRLRVAEPATVLRAGDER